MKKRVLLILIIFVSTVYLSAGETDKAAPMRILVQGDDEAVELVANQKPVILQNTRDKKHGPSAAELKQMAEKSSLENEIIDAMIVKISDLEEVVKRQEIFNYLICGALLMMGVFVFITRRK